MSSRPDSSLMSLLQLRLSQMLQPDIVEPDVKAKCSSMDSKTSPLTPVLDQTHGFELWVQPNSNGEKKFWRATESHSVITFSMDLIVGAM
jgi:hypothetical protein